MVPNEFGNFFFASAGAGAALVGLLFVAISIDPEQVFASDADVERQGTAGSAFNALLNAFFVSLGALIPHVNLGSFTLIMSGFGLFATFRLSLEMVKGQRTLAQLVRRLFWLFFSFIIYGIELVYALILVNNPNNVDTIYNIAILVIAFYGLGVLRAWQLLGARRRSFFDIVRLPRHADNADKADTSIPAATPANTDQSNS
jgi:hypothetical protein